MQTADEIIQVLMVDDDEDDYVLTRDLLAEAVGACFKLDWTNNYDAALQDMTDSEHHVYLVDYLLGEQDGLELLRTALENGCRAPIIMFTGKGDHKVDIEAMKTGAADYLEKGDLSVPLLERTIRYALERKNLEGLKEDVDRIMRHDLKTPLNSIISLAHLLVIDSELSADQLENIQLIEYSAQEMLKKIELSLDMFKMEAGTYEFRPHLIDAITIIKQIVEQNKTKLEKKNLKVHFISHAMPEQNGQTFMISAEHRLLSSLISNLFVNALEASPQNEEIHIVFNYTNPGIIAIYNKGVVPAALRDHFFEKYSTQGKTSGTGLGTYSAKLLARAMHYDISMETSDEQNLTCVKILIPEK